MELGTDPDHWHHPLFYSVPPNIKTIFQFKQFFTMEEESLNKYTNLCALSLPSSKHQHGPKQKKKFRKNPSSHLPKGLKSVNFEHEVLILKQNKKHSWQHKQTLFSFTELINLHGNQPFPYSTETFTHALNVKKIVVAQFICSKKKHNVGYYHAWTHQRQQKLNSEIWNIWCYITINMPDVTEP